MIKKIRVLILSLGACIFAIAASCQKTIIKGLVKNNVSGLTIPSVSITVKGSGAGTYTDERGTFSLTVDKTLPVTLIISSIGYKMQEMNVSNASELVNINLEPESTLGQEVVVAATRTPARILESPVTIERISASNIRNSASTSYYDMIGKLKGVDVVTASLTFSSPSTRGFNGNGNLSVNQIVDGMDNQSPGLNFSVGTIIGLSELDVESIELLQGASSALYGPGGQNGAIIINSKDPFKYEGFSFLAKTGVMHIDDASRPASVYNNYGMRWAQKVSDKFAFKISGEYIQAKDWVADDYRNNNGLGSAGAVLKGTRSTDPNYNGINVYGDETTADIKSNVLIPLAQAAPFYAPYVKALPASLPVSRTGYAEKDIINPNTVDFKVSGMVSYKLSNTTSLNAEGFWGTGNTVYTGADRFSLVNFKMVQYKIEVVNPNWFLRAFTTQENAGDAYDLTVTTRLLNEIWKPSGGATGWYSQYGLAFLNAKIAGMTDIAAENAARSVADIGRPLAGSPQFKEIFDSIRSIPISKGGGKFVDRTNLYNIEGQYNLSPYTSKFADILIGANYRKFVLNSEGTIFSDSTGKIPINAFGAYLQASKHILNNTVNIIASARYDKEDNFTGRLTPRISAVIKVADDNNIRLSYQQAYRFGSTQQQYINLRVGGGTILIGGLETFQTFYHFNTNPVYAVDNNMYAGTPQVQTFNKFKAQSVNSYEIGYKGLLFNKRLLVDMYGYYAVYQDFIVRTVVAQSVNGDKSVFTNPATVNANLNDPSKVTVYSVPTNAAGNVNAYGFGMSLDYALPGNFLVGVNGSSDILENVPAGFISEFNAPKWRAGASFGNAGFGKSKRVGFNITYRWQDDVNYQGDFVSGIVPAFQTMDAQISFKFPKPRVLLKFGATNLLNQYYRDAIGNASIGGIYYVSIGYNVF